MTHETVTIEITAPGISFVGTYPAEAFDAKYFMEAMTWTGRDWEIGFPEFVPLPVGTVATITLPEFEFTARARVVSVDGPVVRLTDV